MLRKLILPATVASVAVLIACATKHDPPPGELMVVVATDMSIPNDVDTIGLEVQAFGNNVFKNEFAVGQGKLLVPATMGVIQGQSPTTPVTIKVWARQNGTARVLREAVTTIPGDRLAVLTMPIQFLCKDQVKEVAGGDIGSTEVDSTCPDGQSCLSGACVDNKVDSTQLPNFAPQTVFGSDAGPTDAGTGGSCFDTLSCFNGAAAVAFDPTTCTADMPADVTHANYGLNTTPSKAGICNSDQSFCVVPLDSGSAGWFSVMTSAGQRIQLPAAACAQVKAKVLTDILVSTTCAAKQTGQATCGAWSSAANSTPPVTDAAPAASCTDGIKNGTETDVDCGGSCPSKCGTNAGCKIAGDCQSVVCTSMQCAAPSCTDGIKNGTETDVDCGGSCSQCATGLGCSSGADCVTGQCGSGKTCACPSGMVSVSKHVTGSSAAYCVDATEVTSGAYSTFLASAPSVGSQDTVCSTWNLSFTPGAGWNSAATNQPVNYVNWCDAFAYCKWASKRLCGNIAGGSNAPAQFANPANSQWFSACSTNGTTAYPYGQTFSATTCDGIGYPGGGAPVTVDSAAACQVGTTGIFDMSGNVSEWEDSCSGVAGPSDSCQARGGSYASQPADLACNANLTYARNQQDPSVGFRCCL